MTSTLSIPPVKTRRNNRYHTDVKIACKYDMLDDETKALIPGRTQRYWKKDTFSDLITIDDERIRASVEALEAFARDHKAVSAYKAILRIKNTMLAVLTDFGMAKIKYSQSGKELVVKTIDRIKDVISVKEACRYFKISLYKYYSWFYQIKQPCPESFIEQCLKTFPNQLTKDEILKMKELLEDAKYKWWPIGSIAEYARRNSIVVAGITTWRKYAKLLGIRRKRPKSRRTKKKVGVRASGPGQIIHCDVSVVKTKDNIKSYLYVVMDNVSRYILSYRVSLENRASIMKENLLDGLTKFAFLTKCPELITCMTDGGPENKRIYEIVDDVHEKVGITIKHDIAGVNTEYSNSMVERFFMTAKYEWLYHFEIPDHEALVRKLEQFIPVYNDERPHSSCGYQTPYEAFTGVQVDRELIKEQFRQAHERRVKHNTGLDCSDNECGLYDDAIIVDV